MATGLEVLDPPNGPTHAPYADPDDGRYKSVPPEWFRARSDARMTAELLAAGYLVERAATGDYMSIGICAVHGGEPAGADVTLVRSMN